MISRAILFFGLVLASGSSVAGQHNPSADRSSQLLQVRSDLTLAGDIDLAGIADQHPQGVLYIDLRTPDEDGVIEDRDEALRLGMRYENIPVDGAQILAIQVAQLDAVLDRRGDFTHTVLRCGSGNRAGMMWGATRIDAGEKPDQVMTQLQTIVTKPAAEQALRDYAEISHR